jgi:hypothetical protein
MAGVRKSMPEMQKFSTFRVLFLAILYFKAGKEARCSFFILQRAHKKALAMDKKETPR